MRFLFFVARCRLAVVRCSLCLLPFAFGLLISISACSDFLDVSPRDELSNEDALSTIAGVRAAMIAAYHGLTFQEHYRQLYPLYPEMAGNMDMSPNAVSGGNVGQSQNVGIVTWRDVSNFSNRAVYENSQFGSAYAQLYRFINRVNNLIEALPKLAEGSPEERESLLGEAHTLRAIGYLTLVNLYGQHYTFTPGATHPGVPLLLRTPSTFETPQRATVGEVYDLIVSDLQTGMEKTGDAAQRSARAIWLSPCAARALLARVYAYMENWQGVINLCSEVIETCPYPLSQGAAYLSGWANFNLPETIFYVDLQEYLADDGSQATISAHGLIIGSMNQTPVCRVSSDLLNLFPAGDLRRELYTDNGRGDILCAKFPFRPNFVSNFPMLRLSEVYLLRAEAQAELGNEPAARSDLNRIFLRANPTAQPISASGEALKAEIMAERRRELAFEGHLLFDLARKRQPIRRTDCTASTCELDYPDYRYVLPIPLDALLNNPALVQNEGYF